MEKQQAYEIIREIVVSLAARGEKVKPLPESAPPDATLDSLGVDLIAFSEIAEDLKARFNGKDFHLNSFLVPDEYFYLTVSRFTEIVANAFRTAKKDQIVVYVDDEEENLFVLKRKFGRQLNLKTFTDSSLALEFIKTNENVGLVITDEVMPILSGNQLCDEVHKAKPMMKFVLITGNPNNDDDLMYRALRKNRFYEFISKPMDLDKKGEEYLAMFNTLLASEL